MSTESKNDAGQTQGAATPLHSDVEPFKFTSKGEIKIGIFLGKNDGKFLFQTPNPLGETQTAETFAIAETDLSAKLSSALSTQCIEGETVVRFEYLGKDAGGNNLFVAETLAPHKP